MIRKGAKFVMVLIMLLGVVFSILNFFSIEVETSANDGHVEVVGGSGIELCYPPGTECSVGQLPRV